MHHTKPQTISKPSVPPIDAPAIAPLVIPVSVMICVIVAVGAARVLVGVRELIEVDEGDSSDVKVGKPSGLD